MKVPLPVSGERFHMRGSPRGVSREGGEKLLLVKQLLQRPRSEWVYPTEGRADEGGLD